MPVDFLTEEQQRRCGRYAGVPSPAQLGRYFHLDDADRGFIARCRGDHNRLGFAAQLGTVRFLGTFLADLTEVPSGVVAHLGRQLGIADATGLRRYAAGEKRWDHAAEIRRRYGSRDFHEGSAAAALTRWLANRAWVSADRPSVLFDLAMARLVERKVLLPGVTVLARLVARVRDQAASRLWRTLARSLKPRQAARLEALLVADEHSWQSPLERLRRAPTRVSVAGMVAALGRLQEIRALGVSHVDLSTVPPVRVQALARYAAAARARAIARMPPPRRHAALLAFAKSQEVAALDDVVDLLDQLITALLARVEHAGQRRRRRTLKDLDGAALLLHQACLVLLDTGCADRRVRETVFARVPRDQLSQAVALVAALVGPPAAHDFESLRTRYSQVRRFLPALLEAVEFAAAAAGRPATAAFGFLKAIAGPKRPDMSQAPKVLLTPAWERVVIGPEGQADRRLYTFCVLERLQDGLRRRDLFVPASRRWGNPYAKLLQGRAWEKVRSRVCRTLGRSPTAAPELEKLGKQLDETYRRTATNLPTNARVVDYQAQIPLTRAWGGGEVASADGLRFIVPVRTLNAGPNPKYFNTGRGVTYYTFTSDQFTGFHAIVVPGTLRDSVFILEGLLEQQTGLRPPEVMSDTAGYSDLVFGLFWLLGYQFSPRLADFGEARFWRIDPKADYGALAGLARQRISIPRIERNWDDVLRVAGSLKMGAVSASELVRGLQGGGRPSTLGRAAGELGRVAKTLYLLNYQDDAAYRRRILPQLNRGESGPGVARAIFHGQRGELRQRYREGQEDQLEALGLVVNAVVLWNTRYLDAALAQARASGAVVKPEDEERLSPLLLDHVTVLGRYEFTLKESVQKGHLRPLRDPSESDDLAA